MHVISRKSKAAKVAALWERLYKDKEQIHKELILLGDSPDPDEVDKIIGNKSWTSCQCNECNKEVAWVIQVGDKPDYESNTAHICEQ